MIRACRNFRYSFSALLAFFDISCYTRYMSTPDLPNRAELHTSYMEHSDTYRGLYETQGATLSIALAERLAMAHDTTLSELVSIEPTMAQKDRVRTLELILTLGY